MRTAPVNQKLALLLEKVVVIYLIAAAVSFGLLRLFKAISEANGEGSSSDTDNYFDNPENRKAILTAIERERQGLCIPHDFERFPIL